jgi:Flp pilus assembly protein TadD
MRHHRFMTVDFKGARESSRERGAAKVFALSALIRVALAMLLAACIYPCPMGATGVEAWSRDTAAASENDALESVQQGYTLLSQKDAHGAELAFRKAISAQPKLAEAHHGLGLALWNLGRKAEAVQEFTVAASLAPGDFNMHYDLAKAAWALADESQESAGPGSTDQQITTDTYRSLAITQMHTVLALRPHDAEIYVALARLYLDAGKPKDAISQAQEAMRLQPSNASAIDILGQAYLADGNSVQAVAHFEKALQQNPHDAAVYVALGNLRLSQGNRAEAEKEFRQAIQSSPNFTPAYAALGHLLEEENQPAQARTVLEREIALDPSDWQADFHLGQIYDGVGNVQKATELYQKALSIHPNFPAARVKLAIGLVNRGDLAGATSQALDIAREDPQAPESHQILALVQWKERNYEGSLSECAIALSADPHSVQILAIEALDLWQQGEKREARDAFVAAAKIQPNLASALTFCRLAACGAQDISIIEDFLRKNRWVLMPPPE